MVESPCPESRGRELFPTGHVIKQTGLGGLRSGQAGGVDNSGLNRENKPTSCGLKNFSENFRQLPHYIGVWIKA